MDPGGLQKGRHDCPARGHLPQIHARFAGLHQGNCLQKAVGDCCSNARHEISCSLIDDMTQSQLFLLLFGLIDSDFSTPGRMFNLSHVGGERSLYCCTSIFQMAVTYALTALRLEICWCRRCVCLLGSQCGLQSTGAKLQTTWQRGKNTPMPS